MSWLTLAVLNLLTLRLLCVCVCVLFQSGVCSKKSSDTPLSSCPGFLKLLSPRCSVLQAGLKSPGALQRHSRLAAQMPNRHRLTLPAPNQPGLPARPSLPVHLQKGRAGLLHPRSQARLNSFPSWEAMTCTPGRRGPRRT